jgi:hypothetical protein
VISEVTCTINADFSLEAMQNVPHGRAVLEPSEESTSAQVPSGSTSEFALKVSYPMMPFFSKMMIESEN